MSHCDTIFYLLIPIPQSYKISKDRDCEPHIWKYLEPESLLNCKEIKPLNPKGNQPWIFIGRIDAEAPILWPPDVNSQLIRKDPDAGKDWGQEEKWVTEYKMVRVYHQLNGYESEQTLGHNEGHRRLAHAVHGVPENQKRLGNWAIKKSLVQGSAR